MLNIKGRLTYISLICPIKLFNLIVSQWFLFGLEEGTGFVLEGGPNHLMGNAMKCIKWASILWTIS